MSPNKKPHIFVVGNEKGGAGKTTCSILRLFAMEMLFKLRISMML